MQDNKELPSILFTFDDKSLTIRQPVSKEGRELMLNALSLHMAGYKVAFKISDPDTLIQAALDAEVSE